MGCKIVVNKNNIPIDVINLHTGESSSLYRQILSIPFIENGDDAIKLYMEITSDEVISKNVFKFNGEPVIRYLSGKSNTIKKVFSSFSEALTYNKSGVTIGLVENDGVFMSDDNQPYVKKASIVPLIEYNDNEGTKESKNQRISNQINEGAISGDKIVEHIDINALKQHNENVSVVGESTIYKEIYNNPNILIDALIQNKEIEKICT